MLLVIKIVVLFINKIPFSMIYLTIFNAWSIRKEIGLLSTVKISKKNCAHISYLAAWVSQLS